MRRLTIMERCFCYKYSPPDSLWFPCILET